MGAKWRSISGSVFLCALPAFGQTLRVSSMSGAPGERISIHVSLESTSTQAATALSWETIFPAGLLEVDGEGPEVGSAAKESGKSLTCALRHPYLYVCLLAGGQKPIANGSVAVFRFRIRAEAHAGTSTLKVDRVDAVTKDLKPFKLGGAEGHVAIQ